MSTIFTDKDGSERTVNGTNRTEALMRTMTGREIKTRGRATIKNRSDVAAAIAPAHHARNVAARAANKAARNAG